MKNQSKFKHLDQRDRDRIHALYGNGHNQKKVAEVLGVNPATISRELARYGRKTWRYNATRAQENADLKRVASKHPGMKIEANPELKRHIIKRLKKLRSPDEIAGRMKKVGTVPRVGKNAIYKWLYSERGQPYCRYLCTRRVKKRKQSRLSKKVLIPDRISFRKRPNTPGLLHAEGDLFVSPVSTGSRACGLLVVAKEEKLFMGGILLNKKHSSIIPAMQHVTQEMSPDTYTLDNGIENVAHRQFGAQSYFCDRGSPWQKPQVEGGIGLIRRWFLPKGTNLSKIPDETFQSQLHLLNHKYRKSLGYKSAYEVSLERGIIQKIPRRSLLKAIAFR